MPARRRLDKLGPHTRQPIRCATSLVTHSRLTFSEVSLRSVIRSARKIDSLLTGLSILVDQPVSDFEASRSSRQRYGKSFGLNLPVVEFCAVC